MTMRAAGAVLEAGLAAAGMAAILVATRVGIGTSVDSVAYIQAARALATGSGDVSLVQHAPLYAFLLAAGGFLGLDPLTGARWLNAFTFGVNILLLGLLIRRSVTHLPWLWVAGSALMLVSVPMLTVHVTALSEPVFLACLLLGFWSLARYLEHPTPAWLVMSGVATSLALLARYAGAACIVTGALAILFLGQASWRQRVRDTVLFGAVAVVPMAAWLARNMMVASSATGRELSFHPVGRSHAWQALYTMSGWLLIPQSAPDAIRFAVWAPLGVLLLVVAARSLRAPASVPVVVKVLVIFVATYGAFLATSISFLDANTPLDDRILLPVLAASLVLVAYVLDSLWPVARRVPALAYATLPLIVLLMAGQGFVAAEVAAAGYEKGWGFSSVTWRQSPTLSHVARLQADIPVFSNAPEVVYLNAGRQARGIPRTRFLMSQQPNREFAEQLTAVGQEVRATCGVVVYLRNLTQKAMPSETDVRDRLALDVLLDTDDGVIWGVTACRQ